jgi:plasmid rolling circle replication initiator protein Rep
MVAFYVRNWDIKCNFKKKGIEKSALKVYNFFIYKKIKTKGRRFNLLFECSISADDCQEVLVDRSENGKERPWNEKMLGNEKLVLVYRAMESPKAARVFNCARTLTFEEQDNGMKRLKMAFFCRCRLCPMCMWRRSLKTFFQMKKIVDELKKDENNAYIFATFTVKNCDYESLGAEIDSMMGAWKRFCLLKPFKRAIRGFFRSFEVTHNLDKKSASYDSFHPHFHCIFVVDKNYFTHDDYISFESWVYMWRTGLKVPYNPSIRVQRVNLSRENIIAEMAKYTAKESDYIIYDDFELSVKTVELLDSVLHNRRFISMGGRFKVLHKQLCLDKLEDSNLINVDFDSRAGFEAARKVIYFWSSEYKQYLKM